MYVFEIFLMYVPCYLKIFESPKYVQTRGWVKNSLQENSYVYLVTDKIKHNLTPINNLYGTNVNLRFYLSSIFFKQKSYKRIIFKVSMKALTNNLINLLLFLLFEK